MPFLVLLVKGLDVVTLTITAIGLIPLGTILLLTLLVEVVYRFVSMAFRAIFHTLKFYHIFKVGATGIEPAFSRLKVGYKTSVCYTPMMVRYG